MSHLAGLVRDLGDEQDALERVMRRLPSAAWERPTPCEGWRVRDQIAHLAFFDGVAAMAVVAPDRFDAEVKAATADLRAYEAGYIARGRALGPQQLLDWWCEARRTLLEALQPLDEQARLPWYGIVMSARSFTTARLMESWSHGHDIVDAVGATPAYTDRLRHVAFLGARTRAYAYVARGLARRSEPIRIELVLPSGAPWVDGDSGAGDRIVGPAADFCLVVTQRRHVEDTTLQVSGSAAEEWVRIAQAFAGPPGPGRRPGQFRKP